MTTSPGDRDWTKLQPDVEETLSRLDREGQHAAAALVRELAGTVWALANRARAERNARRPSPL